VEKMENSFFFQKTYFMSYTNRSSARVTSPSRRGRDIVSTGIIDSDTSDIEFSINELLDQVEKRYGGKLKENRNRAFRLINNVLDDFISSPNIEESSMIGYHLFMKENKNKAGHILENEGVFPSSRNIDKEVARMWRDLSHEQKEDYRMRVLTRLNY
jgi:hypothetical protein